MVEYFVEIRDWFGTPIPDAYIPLGDVGAAGLEFGIRVGHIGYCHLQVPSFFDPRVLRKDYRVLVWRSLGGSSPQIEGDAVFLIRQWKYAARKGTHVKAVHANDLLRRRIISYNAGSSFTGKGPAPAGNIIKAFARENFGPAINTVRDGDEIGADISAYLAIEPDKGDGATISKSATRKNLFETIIEICQASTQAGTYLAAEVVTTSGSDLVLKTYVGQRGTDRRGRVIFGTNYLNVENALLNVDATDEVTFAVAGGTGQEDVRIIRTAFDAARLTETPLNRIERFHDDTNLDNPVAVQANADMTVRAGIPSITYEADIVMSSNAIRGVHYNYGDFVTVDDFGYTFNSRIDVLTVSVNARKVTERIQLREAIQP